MKSFKTFRLDTVNHLLHRDGDRVPLAPKAFDLLAYLVDNAGRLVTQEEILQALWAETYVNPEVLRKYILEIRKALGDRAEQPEFIETLPKRGYRFVASVRDEDSIERIDPPASPEIERATEHQVESEAAAPQDRDSLPEDRLRTWALVSILAVIAVAAAISGYFLFARRSADAASPKNISIAVLPFADMSAANDQEYFSDGLAEQLINDLAKAPGIKVIGRSSAFQFKGKNEDARVVGRKLGVANVLEGSVRRDGDNVRITAELIEADDGFQLWSQTYDRQLKDIFAVQDEIAQSATQALQVKLLGGNSQAFDSSARSANPEAYQAYLQAEYFKNRGQSKEDFSQALSYAGKAIALDQRYASAWALRASMESAMAELALTDPPEGFRKARGDAERAIELDPNLDSAYLALAHTQVVYDWDWDAAEVSVNRVAALEPGSVEALRIRAYLTRILGRLDQAVQMDKEAVELDPLQTDSYVAFGQVLLVTGQYEGARTALNKALELNPQAAFVHFSLGELFLFQGKPQQALGEAEQESVDWAKSMLRALAYHKLGREGDSNAALNDLVRTHQMDAALQVAQVYAFRGQNDKAFEWLERAYKQRDSGLPTIKTELFMDDLRHDPRYADLVAKMRLPK